MYTEFSNFLHATLKGMPVLVIGATHSSTTGVYFVYVEEDGQVGHSYIKDFIVDVRFKEGQWHDVDPGFASE